jgi:hypothetical protein
MVNQAMFANIVLASMADGEATFLFTTMSARDCSALVQSDHSRHSDLRGGDASDRPAWRLEATNAVAQLLPMPTLAARASRALATIRSPWARHRSQRATDDSATTGDREHDGRARVGQALVRWNPPPVRLQRIPIRLQPAAVELQRAPIQSQSPTDR